MVPYNNNSLTWKVRPTIWINPKQWDRNMIYLEKWSYSHHSLNHLSKVISHKALLNPSFTIMMLLVPLFSTSEASHPKICHVSHVSLLCLTFPTTAPDCIELSSASKALDQGSAVCMEPIVTMSWLMAVMDQWIDENWWIDGLIQVWFWGGFKWIFRLLG
jgi:hypothetical protein